MKDNKKINTNEGVDVRGSNKLGIRRKIEVI